MTLLQFPSVLRVAAAVMLVACDSQVFVAPLAAQAAVAPLRTADDVVFVQPARRPANAVPLLPALPRAADDITPITLQVAIRRTTAHGRTSTLRQTVSRTRERVHIEAGPREWLFVRNPIDTRRVSGVLVDHTTRTIVEHEESDLRNMIGVAGWFDVLSMGLDPAALGRLTAGETRTIEGIRFRRHSAPARTDGLSDAWWCEEQLLASQFVVRTPEGTTRLSVDRLQHGVDVKRLDVPSVRFPDYRVVDLAEWLERR